MFVLALIAYHNDMIRWSNRVSCYFVLNLNFCHALLCLWTLVISSCNANKFPKCEYINMTYNVRCVDSFSFYQRNQIESCQSDTRMYNY